MQRYYHDKKCFKCGKKIKEDNRFMLGLDKPYVNLWFHKACFDKIDNLMEYLNTKIDEIYKEIPNYT